MAAKTCAPTSGRIIVGIVALPLSMALAVASGWPRSTGSTPPSSLARLAGVQIQPMQVLARSGVQKRQDRIAVYSSMDWSVDAALERSRISDRILAG